MDLILVMLQGVALVCAILALSLPAYVFVVLVWSCARSAGGALSEAGSSALLALDRSIPRLRRAKAPAQA